MTKKKSKQQSKKGGVTANQEPKSPLPQDDTKQVETITIAIGIGSHSCTVAYYNPVDQKAFIIPNPDGFYATPSTITPEDSDSGHSDTVGRAWYASRDQITGFFESVELNTIPLKESMLRFLVHIAEDYTGKSVRDVVLVTAIDHTDQQKALIEKILKQNMGLNVLQTVSEPLCACVAYGLDKASVKSEEDSSAQQPVDDDEAFDKQEIILVADFGFKTSTATLISRQTHSGLLTLLHSETSDQIGGAQIDQTVLELMIAEINRKHFNNRMAKEYREIFSDQASNPVRKLKQTMDELKTTLSNRDKANISIESLIDGIDVHLEISRAKFEQGAEKVLNQSTGLIDSCVSNAKRNKLLPPDFTIAGIGRVILTGGISRVIRLKQIILKHLAITDENVKDKCFDSIEYASTAGGTLESFVIEEQIREEQDQGSKKKKKKKAPKSNQAKKLEYDDVKVPSIPETIALNTHGDGLLSLFPRFTKVPCQNEVVVSNAFDQQEYMLVRVVQGERLLASQNKEIGLYVLELQDKDNSRARGELECKLMFSVDEQGVLSVEVDEPDEESDSNKQVKFLLHNVKMEERNESVEESQEQEIQEDDEDLIWSKKRVESVTKTVNEHISEAIAQHDSDLVAVENRDARIKLEGYCYRCRRVLREQYAGDDNKLETIDNYVNDVLQWVNDNSNLTKKEYLVKLHEFHSFFTSNQKK